MCYGKGMICSTSTKHSREKTSSQQQSTLVSPDQLVADRDI